MSTYNHLFFSMLFIGACLVTAFARSEVRPLDDEALSAVWGQSLLELQNTSYAGRDFARFTINADIDISANLGQITAGLYESGNLNVLSETGVALNVGTLQLGRSDAGDSQRLVTLTNPYLELAYSNIENDTIRSLVGMRMGFEGVNGQMGVAMSALTGAVRIDLGNELFYDTLVDTPDLTQVPQLTDIGVLRAGNAQGPSRDFFVSVLSQAVAYPSIKGVESSLAMPGVWVNWRDRLSGALGMMPPNASK